MARQLDQTRIDKASIGAALAVVGAVLWFLSPFVLDRAIIVERDALSSILPIRAFLAHSLRAGEWPMWNPAPVLGKPYLPEWQTGLFYPPSLLLAVPPFSRGFNLFLVFHYVWTAIGAFLLLRALRVSRIASSVGALVWTLGGPLVSLGHLLNQLMAIAWLPWVLWGWVRTDDLRRKIAACSVMLGIALLTGSPEMTLLIAGSLVALTLDPRTLVVPPIAGLLASMQLLPGWLYLGQTQQGVHGLPTDDVLAYSTELAHLPGVVLAGPRPSDAFLPSLYEGPLPVALAFVALFFVPSIARLTGILAVTVLLALALGANTGIFPALHTHVPGMDLMRYPEKLFLGIHAVIALGAAVGLGHLVGRLPERTGSALALLVALLCFGDLARINRDLLVTMSPQQALAPPPAALAIREAGARRYYANETGAPRSATTAETIAVDRALLSAATGELFGLGNVNTPASLNLVAHEQLHRSLEELLPPQALASLRALGTRFVTSYDDIHGPGIQAVPVPDGSARLYDLGRTSRAFVARRVRIAADAQAALARFVRANEPAGLAILEGVGVEDLRYESPGDTDIQWTEDSPDEIVLDVSLDAPGLLVVNDTYSDGWRATVDGTAARIERVNGVVRGVWLPAGKHEVAMNYLSLIHI